ncbi:MAG: hypothetical protein ABL962_05905 [Fimbriimonadaceae bacterium]
MIVAVVLVLAVGAGIWLLSSRPARFQLVGSSGRLHAFPREELATKPRFDFNFLGLGRVVWPQPPPTVDPPLAFEEAGVIAVNGTGHIRSWQKWSTWVNGQHLLSKRNGLRCPYVFGNESRETVLELDNGTLLKVLLPPNGKPEPKLPRIRIPTGPGFVVAEPLPWVSPSFPIGYQVSLEGFPADSVWYVEVTFESNDEFDGYVSGVLRRDESIFLPVTRWKEDIVFNGALLRVKPEIRPAIVRKVDGPLNLRIEAEEGEPLIVMKSESDGRRLIPNRKYKCIQVLDLLYRTFISRCSSDAPDDTRLDVWKELPKLGNGLKFIAIGFRLTGEQHDFSTPLRFPSMSSVGASNVPWFYYFLR